jgi:hypothetical protein
MFRICRCSADYRPGSRDFYPFQAGANAVDNKLNVVFGRGSFPRDPSGLRLPILYESTQPHMSSLG